MLSSPAPAFHLLALSIQEVSGSKIQILNSCNLYGSNSVKVFIIANHFSLDAINIAAIKINRPGHNIRKYMYSLLYCIER